MMFEYTQIQYCKRLTYYDSKWFSMELLKHDLYYYIFYVRNIPITFLIHI